MKRLAATRILAGSAIALMVIPTVVFVGSALYRGMGMSETIAALGDQFTADKLNLLVVSLLGLVPLLLVILLIVVRKLMRRDEEGSVAYARTGIVPIFLVTLFMNLEYWPTYLPTRQFLGFPHGLEFVIGPFVFAPIGVLIGFLVVWVLRRRA